MLSRKFELCTSSLTVTFAARLQSLAVLLQWCCLCLFSRVDVQGTSLNQHHAHDLQAWHCCCTNSMSVRTMCSHSAALCPTFRQHGSTSHVTIICKKAAHNSSVAELLIKINTFGLFATLLHTVESVPITSSISDAIVHKQTWKHNTSHTRSKK